VDSESKSKDKKEVAITAEVKESIVFRGKKYHRAGSFFSKEEARGYTRKLRATNGYAMMLTIDNPKQMGKGIRYHVYTR